MPWIHEVRLGDAYPELEAGVRWNQEMQISNPSALSKSGLRLVRRYWKDDDPPHRYSPFHLIDAMSVAKNGRTTFVTHHYTERGKKEDLKLYYNADDIIAFPFGDHHDDRLILPGGFLQAHPGTMWGAWDVFLEEGVLLARGVSVKRGRALLDPQHFGELN